MLTGVRIEIDGSTISLLATDRFRLSHRELDWNPHTPDDSLAALVPAKVLGDTAKSLTAGTEVTIALSAGRHRRGHHRLRGRGGRRHPSYDDPAARRRVPQGPQPVPQRAPRPRALVDKLALIESVKRVSLVAERNTAVQLAVQRRRAHPRRRLRRRGPGLGVDRGDHRRASDITTGFNPQFLLDGLTAIDEAVVELAFTQASKPVVISGSIGDDGRRPRTPASATC